jgi:hypothetical protein
MTDRRPVHTVRRKDTHPRGRVRPDREDVMKIRLASCVTMLAASGEITMQAAKGDTNRVLTFKLGANGKLPASGRTTRVLNLRPDTPPTKDAFERGLSLYQVNCMICHGDTGVSGGVVPDLRYSATLGSTETWKAILLDGSLVNNGMVKFDGISSRTRWRRSAPM